MKILFFSVNPSTFVLRDLKILKSENEVTFLNQKSFSPFSIIKEIKKHDLTFFWFASLRFFIPILISKILKKKIIIIAGGYDVAKYGSMSSGWKSILIKLMLAFADKIIAVSNSNKNEIIDNCKVQPSKIEMVYHGFEQIKQIDFSKKTDKIITIAQINNMNFFYNKGIERFFRLAEVLPNMKFHLIGKVNLTFEGISVPDNVILNGYLNYGGEKFNSLLESAKIYIQFSQHESFGCSVAEAMQFGCIPIVSNTDSLPEVVGNCGLIIDNFNDYESLGSQIKKILKDYSPELSQKCMERVKNKFSYQERAVKINDIIKNLN